MDLQSSRRWCRFQVAVTSDMTWAVHRKRWQHRCMVLHEVYKRTNLKHKDQFVH
ncbi:uncharacterized protein DS421_12g379780 [Arachis hypogaea]|nr:uncharacterized protein DS421_12g379780 [Arachis hypogaea]